MRIWFKIFDDTRMIASETIEDYSEETRTHKIFRALEEACNYRQKGYATVMLKQEQTKENYEAYAQKQNFAKVVFL